MTTRVLGIDPGLVITGYGCLDLDDGALEPRLVEGGAIKLTASRSMNYRLKQLSDDLNTVLDDLKPDLMVVETLFSHVRQVKTAIIMGHARGVVLLAGQTHGLAFDELTAPAVKKAIAGNGRATKAQIQRAVADQLGLPEPSPPDVADALAIALCAARRLSTKRATEQATSDPVVQPEKSP